MKKLCVFLLCSIISSGTCLDINAHQVECTNTANIIMVGDCLIHSTLYNNARHTDGTYNFDYMFKNVIDDIQGADIAIINQETIFTYNSTEYSSYPRFGSPVAVGEAEVDAGFDIIACATNHTMDKGIQGIKDTLDFWSNYKDIGILGIHSNREESDIYYKTVNNIKIGFVNYTYGLNGLENYRTGKEYCIDLLSDSDIIETLQEAEENDDITIAILHVGEEYVYKPTKYEQKQVDKFIDNGADIIFCAHPHVVEPYEIRTTDNGNSALVYYSLGNFISAQDEPPRCLGGMANVTIYKTTYSIDDTEYNAVGVLQYDMIPLVTHQQKGYYTTFKLEDYTDELADRHRLKEKGLTNDYLYELYNSIINS